MEADYVNMKELPEDAARRFAKEVLSLRARLARLEKAAQAVERAWRMYYEDDGVSADVAISVDHLAAVLAEKPESNRDVAQ